MIVRRRPPRMRPYVCVIAKHSPLNKIGIGSCEPLNPVHMCACVEEKKPADATREPEKPAPPGGTSKLPSAARDSTPLSTPMIGDALQGVKKRLCRFKWTNARCCQRERVWIACGGPSPMDPFSPVITMARLSILLIISQLLILPGFGKEKEEQNPLADITNMILENIGSGGGEGLGTLGSVLGTLMQADGSKNNGGSEVISGLGTLLASQASKMDPETLGTVISLVSQLAASANEDSTQRSKRDTQETGGVDMNNVLNLISGLLNSKNAESYMPIIMNVISSFTGSQTDKIAHEHKDHADFLPPYLEKAHLYWDVFANSELGKVIWKKSGLEKATKAFKGPDGKLSLELMLKNLENHSFRRHWIKAAAVYLTDMVVHMAKPEVYKKYLASAQYLINGYLDSQNLPKSTHFNVAKPEKSIAALVNHMLKKYLDMDADVSAYVKPAVDYVKQTLKMAQSTGEKLASRGDYHAIADRLTDTLNLEVIEPVLRVYRAYRHSLANPQCQEHLMCLVNKHHDQDKQGLAGFKAGLTKLSSLVASAAISYQQGKGFWDLYIAIQHDDCEAKYPADCAAFHEHEMKVTTEVYHHSEL